VTKRHSPAAAVSATEFGEAAEPFIQGRGSSREYPATSAARIAARRRVVGFSEATAAAARRAANPRPATST
jgi:hypothetical protein